MKIIELFNLLKKVNELETKIKNLEAENKILVDSMDILYSVGNMDHRKYINQQIEKIKELDKRL